MQAPTRTVADVVAAYFKALGLEQVFIYPGGTIAPIINACIAVGIDVEVFKHEQGAVYAAMAKARLTRRPQVAMVTSGPGVTNAVTPLADAFYDSTPLMLITGQIGTGDLKSGRAVRQRGFQETPTVELTKPISKDARCPLTVADSIRDLEELMALAAEGRQGPVVLDFPMDMQRSEAGPDVAVPSTASVDGARVVKSVPPAPLAEIATAAGEAKRPVIFLGQGALIAGAFEAYASLAERLDAFVVCSLPGLGAFAGDNPRFLGFIGHTGHGIANRAVHEADFLLVLGARLDIRQTGSEVKKFVPNGRVAWINDDPTELAYPRVAVDWPVECDAGAFADELLRALGNSPAVDGDGAWRQTIRAERDKDGDDPESLTRAGLIAPKTALRSLRAHMSSDGGVVTTGVGSHQQWTARHLCYAPDGWRLLTSAGHGAMGFDLPSAVGAAMTDRDRTVVCVVGDGSFLMNVQELASITERNLNVKVLLLNNHRLGIVSQFQRITWGTDHGSGAFATPDYAAIARGFGMPAARVEKLEDLDAGVAELMSGKGPRLLEVFIDHDAEVVPMLLAGQTMDGLWWGYA